MKGKYDFNDSITNSKHEIMLDTNSFIEPIYTRQYKIKCKGFKVNKSIPKIS